MTDVSKFSIGEIVHARGREWVVLEADKFLTIRPLTGSERDSEKILPSIEIDPVSSSIFAPPTIDDEYGGRSAAQFLRNSLRLSLRRGAGPFRSFGRLNFRPRAYQLAPLMMALRQDVIRLLIADDVGIGKTIEAGLILRELIDRGELSRFSVLCPAHLVDQWSVELNSKFSIPAIPVTAAAATRLEHKLPSNTSLFDAYPYTIVSLDFIKHAKRVHDFQKTCPNMVVVDEAHSAVRRGKQRQQRFELVRNLANNVDRQLILLTATPHSGDETAFHNLLGLIDTEFAKLEILQGKQRQNLRRRLANYFIQRRRKDINTWQEEGIFPELRTLEWKYRLSGEFETFYRAVLDYCTDIIQFEDGAKRHRLVTWVMLSLMRCVGSSPAAALRALRGRAGDNDNQEGESDISAHVRDDEEFANDDFEPGVGTDETRILELITKAEILTRKRNRNSKFNSLVKILSVLIEDGFKPIVFCKYIATATSLADDLKSKFKFHEIKAVTGLLSSDEREFAVEELGKYDRRILVATDCLSEGINLQAWFDSIVHYDLSWNPTRHQQRNGRVDRFETQRLEVFCFTVRIIR